MGHDTLEIIRIFRRTNRPRDPPKKQTSPIWPDIR